MNGAITTDIPARLDRLPWSAWHWRVVIALGITWLLDGLEVTVVGSLAPTLQRPDTLGASASEIGWAASAYIGGAVLGAIFGRLVDHFGRKRMFLVTLVVYLIATMLTAFTWDIASFAFCRFLTGFGIGGEYAAINSAIDELIPARGRVALAINGTFWVGAAMGAGLSIVLDPALIGRVGLAHRLSSRRRPRLRHPPRASPPPRARAGCSCMDAPPKPRTSRAASNTKSASPTRSISRLATGRRALCRGAM